MLDVAAFLLVLTALLSDPWPGCVLVGSRTPTISRHCGVGSQFIAKSRCRKALVVERHEWSREPHHGISDMRGGTEEDEWLG